MSCREITWFSIYWDVLSEKPAVRYVVTTFQSLVFFPTVDSRQLEPSVDIKRFEFSEVPVIEGKIILKMTLKIFLNLGKNFGLRTVLNLDQYFTNQTPNL